MRSFAHERFHVLPGATDERVAERYLAWARQLVAEDPGWCAEVLERTTVRLRAGSAAEGEVAVSISRSARCTQTPRSAGSISTRRRWPGSLRKAHAWVTIVLGDATTTSTASTRNSVHASPR